VPAAVGVPTILPVALLSDSPVGSNPLVIDHVYGCVPPVPVNVAEYGVPVVPLGNDWVVMTSGLIETVRLVFPVLPFNEAEIVVVPAPTAEASPLMLTGATSTFDELQRA